MATAYVVAHSKVGHHLEGTVITIGPEDEAAGIDIQNLLEKGSIREASDEEAATAIPVQMTSGFVNPGFPVILDEQGLDLDEDGTLVAGDNADDEAPPEDVPPPKTKRSRAKAETPPEA